MVAASCASRDAAELPLPASCAKGSEWYWNPDGSHFTQVLAASPSADCRLTTSQQVAQVIVSRWWPSHAAEGEAAH